MQTSLNHEILNKVAFLTGTIDIVDTMVGTPAKEPFDERVISFLNDVSREIMKNPGSKAFSDVVTFGFWIRKSSTAKLKSQHEFHDNVIHLGKGIAFHIAPSNVPCNFAYSLVSGLLTGNANIVRVPSKAFPQVDILVDAFNKTLEQYEDMKPYVVLVRYGRDKEINDLFSSIADVRVVWGGDQTISELRKSELPPRASEITFADRYSLAVIDSESYLADENKSKIAEDFYNDTFFSDQNACTSPRIIVWMGNRINDAKKIFWEEEHNLVEQKYSFQAIQAVNKLTSSYLIAAAHPEVKVEKSNDNLITRIAVSEIKEDLMNYRDNSGYFYEYDCENILDIKNLCNDKSCQTIAYIGNKDAIMPLVRAGVKGIDRVVPMGKTMDFDLIWDGYNLPALMTRTIVMA